MQERKIAIIGISGSGKSVISRKIAKLTNLPIFHMDTVFWKGDWEAVSEEEYLKAHEDLVSKDEWVIEGYIDEKMKNRVEQADLVLYLDYAGLLCAWRLIRRWFKHYSESRPELPQEALEKLDKNFLWLVFTRGERKNIENVIKDVELSKLARVHSPKYLDRLIRERFN